MSLNKVMLIGNVGRDPEIRHLANNSIVASFPLATSEKFKLKSGELQEQTEWHNIVCWQSLAELAENYIKKGSRLYLEGRIKTNSWIDKTSQEKRYSTDIIASSILFLDRAPSSSDGNTSANGNASAESKASANSNASAQIEELINKNSENSADGYKIDKLPF